MKRTNLEIEKELTALKTLRDKVPHYSIFGDDNQASVEAQIRAIEERLDFYGITDTFEEDGDYILSSALTAFEWLQNDDVAPSESWNEMLKLIEEETVELIA